MTLERGQIIGYDTERMTFEFTMTSPNGKLVHCKISSAALDQLEGGKGTPPSERETQFIRLRDEIERITSDLFSKGVPSPISSIRIFSSSYPVTAWLRQNDYIRIRGPPSAA